MKEYKWYHKLLFILGAYIAASFLLPLLAMLDSRNIEGYWMNFFAAQLVAVMFIFLLGLYPFR